MPRKYNRYQKQILLNMPGATHFRNLCKYNILKEKNTTQKQQECNFSLILRSCFKFIPRQIETYVEADWSPRQGLNMAGTYLLAMIILFLNKFKTAS